MNRFLPPGARLLFIICIAVAILFMVTGCGMPAQQSVTTFDQWVAKNETVLIVTKADTVIADALNGAGGGYDPVHRIAAVDLDMLTADGADADQTAFRIAHEKGHGLALFLGLHFVPDNGTAAGEEQKAQCIARVVTDIMPVHLGGETDATGYWTCPEPYLSETRGAMLLAGIVP